MAFKEDDTSAVIKLQLVDCIREIIIEKGWTQTQAAQELSISRARLCRILGGQIKDVSEGRLLKCLTRLGRDIQINISHKHAGTGEVVVVNGSPQNSEFKAR